MKNIIKQSYLWIAYIVAIVMLLVINFNNFFNNDIPLLNNIIALITISVALICLNKFVLSKIKKRTSIIVIISMLLIFLILEIITVCYLKVEPRWDFKWVMDSAKQLATTRYNRKFLLFSIISQ